MTKKEKDKHDYYDIEITGCDRSLSLLYDLCWTYFSINKLYLMDQYQNVRQKKSLETADQWIRKFDGMGELYNLCIGEVRTKHLSKSVLRSIISCSYHALNGIEKDKKLHPSNFDMSVIWVDKVLCSKRFKCYNYKNLYIPVTHHFDPDDQIRNDHMLKIPKFGKIKLSLDDVYKIPLSGKIRTCWIRVSKTGSYHGKVTVSVTKECNADGFINLRRR